MLDELPLSEDPGRKSSSWLGQRLTLHRGGAPLVAQVACRIGFGAEDIDRSTLAAIPRNILVKDFVIVQPSASGQRQGRTIFIDQVYAYFDDNRSRRRTGQLPDEQVVCVGHNTGRSHEKVARRVDRAGTFNSSDARGAANPFYLVRLSVGEVADGVTEQRWQAGLIAVGRYVDDVFAILGAISGGSVDVRSKCCTGLEQSPIRPHQTAAHRRIETRSRRAANPVWIGNVRIPQPGASAGDCPANGRTENSAVRVRRPAERHEPIVDGKEQVVVVGVCRLRR